MTDNDKVSLTIELAEDHPGWLDEMIQKYDLEDRSKAIRVLIDFAIKDGDLENIFREVRCRHC
jgi:metal-responsive CopG/Arc/MetJ family transcriptional regulator